MKNRIAAFFFQILLMFALRLLRIYMLKCCLLFSPSEFVFVSRSSHGFVEWDLQVKLSVRVELWLILFFFFCFCLVKIAVLE